MIHTTGQQPMINRTYLATVILAVVSSFFCLSCGNKDKQLGPAVTSRDSTSVITTRGVDMLISENGMIRYHVIAEEWKIFDKMKPPFYSMEEGVLLEILDTLMQVESKLVADTAYYMIDDEIWHLRHNVHAENIKKEEFDTNELFVDNRRNRMYSDSLIHIKQDRQIIVGHGFESNSNLTEYTIRKTEGVFPVTETK
ncbi:MAG: LPS export ABC transporter periplasmic protein LptC [Bacteroidaceae bacterium]|nr:LPS export ABC transporter periplasmic protein LptC [Bacteroidaceae bacterium]